jgi:hypothetical protein
MKKPKMIFAVTLIAAMALSSSASFSGVTAVAPPIIHHSKPVVPFVIFGCAGALIFAALIANWQQKRQLTAAEAMTCGLLFWFTPPRP